MKKSWPIILLSFMAQSLFSQSDSLVFQYGLFPVEEPTELRQISVNGFYRFFGTYTQQHKEYLLDDLAGVSTAEKTVFIGDDSQLPNLWVNFTGKPGPNSSFGFDIYTFQFLDGSLNETYGSSIPDSLIAPNETTSLGNGLGSALFLNLGMNLSGQFKTKVGSYNVNLGGTNWYHLSDLTFSSFRGFNRFGLFERNPWDPVEKNLKDRYTKFFEEGSIQQDERWGNQAFQGLIVDGTALPHNMTISLLHGKTQIDGGILSNPFNSTGGRIRKDFSKGQFISLNTFNTRRFADSLNINSVGFNVHTFEFVKELDDISVHAEIGAGRYYAPDYESEWGEAINFKVKYDNEFLPFEVQYFRISDKVVNNNAIYWNTAIPEFQVEEVAEGNSASQVLFPFASSMTRIGQMTNNRQGLNINGDFTKGDFNLSLGLGAASELEGLNNTVSFSHPVNALTRSRFWRWEFPSNVGPYNRYNVVYRGTFDELMIKEGENGPVAKHFNNIEILAKQKLQVAQRDLFIMLLGQYNSVQDFASPITVFSEEAYLRLYSTELEAYYFVGRKLALSTYVGYERALGNYDTDIDLFTRRPRNQTGFGLGFGVDISIAKNSVLVLRHRNFEFEDSSFEKDRFKGSESLVELKVFF